MFGNMSGHEHKFHIYLQRCVAQQTEQLGLGFNFGGHQIENHDFQRTDVLMHGPFMGHNKDVLGFQHFNGRQGCLDTNRHGIPSFMGFYIIGSLECSQYSKKTK